MTRRLPPPGTKVEALFDRPDQGLQGWTPGVIVEAPPEAVFDHDIWVRPDGHDLAFWFPWSRDIRIVEQPAPSGGGS